MKRYKTLRDPFPLFMITSSSRAVHRRGTRSYATFRLKLNKRPRRGLLVVSRVACLASPRQWQAAADCWHGLRNANGPVIRACLRAIEAEHEARRNEKDFA